MNSTQGRILLIEDDPGLGSQLCQILTEEGHDVQLERRGDDGFAAARRNEFDLVVTDLRLPGKGGLELVHDLHLAKPRLPIILITAHGTAETAIQATRDGAFDYLLKPFEIPEFLSAVAQALQAGRLMGEPVELGAGKGAPSALVGKSRVMQTLYKEIGRVASRPVNVLLLGETGTGKELIARALYQHSDRARAPFVAVNCAAIPETLLESEMFGHERGAFTGAHAARIGRFEQASHGTIFLDEIGEMPLGTQAKLLRVIQEQRVERLGGKNAIPVDVRVITATNQNLEELIRQNRFRQDLFFRLSVVSLRLPPLRERPEDIPDLVDHFLRKYGPDLGAPHPSIQPDAVQELSRLYWPGNVRELENIVRKLLLMTRGFRITREHVRSLAAATESGETPADTGLGAVVAELLASAERGDDADVHARLIEAVEKELFRQAILLSGGNQAKAARWLGISRLTMREKLLHFGLHPGSPV